MAALDVRMVLSLVDKASGPAKGIMARLFGANGKRGNVMDSAGMSATAANGAMMMLNRTMATFAAGAAGYVGFRSMIKGAVEFEAAFTDVRKKVNASPTEFARLEARIKQLARTTPLAASEIAGLVAQAGQFGIANEDLLRFSQLGAKSAVAFEMSATDAADSLSQMKNALKLNMDQLEDYADAINSVADSTGSSEQQLVDFVLRTGPGAMAAGLDPKDLLAFGSALTEVGLQSNRAGTAVNGMLAKMANLTAKKKTVEILDKIAGKGYSERLQKKFFDKPRDALIDIMKITKEMSRPDRARLFIDLFGLETQDEAMAFAGQVDKVIQTLHKLEDASWYKGSVKKTFELFAATTGQQWKRFTNNVGLAASAMGAQLLPAINGSLDYLNTFFATAEGRVSIFDRLSTAANGFFNGLGYKGGAAEALSGVVANLKTIRDIIFGVKGDGMSGDKLGELFRHWQQFGASLHDSPIATMLDSIKNANARDLGGALLAGAAGMGALSIAARVALSPLRGMLSIMQGIVKTAYTLSGLRTAKWLYDLIGGKGPGGASPTGPSSPGGGILNALGLTGASGLWAGLVQGLGDTPGETFDDQVANQKMARDRLRKMFGMGGVHPSHFQEHERDDLSTLADDQQRRTNLQGFLNPPPQAGSQNEFEKMIADMDAAKAKGAELQSALNVTAKPIVDMSDIDALLSKLRQAASLLTSVGAASVGVNANIGGKVTTALRQNLADGGQ